MGRPAKCRYCQEKVTTNNAYKTEINKKTAYFCNKEHYEQFIKQADEKLKEKETEKALKEKLKAELREKELQEKEDRKRLRDKVYKLFAEVLGVNNITNTALYKEKAEINKAFSDEVIISYLEENKEWISKAVGRLSGGEYGKIRYVSVILRNKLGDYNPKVVNTEVKTEQIDARVDVGLRVNKKRKNVRRKGFAEMED